MLVYEYVFVPGIKSNLSILIIYSRPCDVFHKWGYCTFTYKWIIHFLHQSLRVVKTFQLLQVKILLGARVPLGGSNFTPYSDLQKGRSFDNKDNQNTLIPRYSGNSTQPTVNPPTARGYQETSFNTYNIFKLRTLYTIQRHLSRYWQCYDEHHQQVFSGCEVKKYFIDPPWRSQSNW